MRGYRTGTGKKKLRVLLFLVLMLTLCVSSAVPAAAESLSSERPRQLQADILEWKRAAEGNDQILSGALLDGAGGASSDWIAFNISRIGI